MNKREIDEYDDVIVNGSLTIEELYNFAKDNNALDYKIEVLSKEDNTKFNSVVINKFAKYGKGWGKGTIILHAIHEIIRPENSQCG